MIGSFSLFKWVHSVTWSDSNSQLSHHVKNFDEGKKRKTSEQAQQTSDERQSVDRCEANFFDQRKCAVFLEFHENSSLQSFKPATTHEKVTVVYITVRVHYKNFSLLFMADDFLSDVVLQPAAWLVTLAAGYVKVIIDFFQALSVCNSTDSCRVVSNHKELHATTLSFRLFGETFVLAVDLIVNFEEFQFFLVFQVAVSLLQRKILQRLVVLEDFRQNPKIRRHVGQTVKIRRFSGRKLKRIMQYEVESFDYLRLVLVEDVPAVHLVYRLLTVFRHRHEFSSFEHENNKKTSAVVVRLHRIFKNFV